MSATPIEAAAKVLRVLKALKGHSLQGVSNAQLARGLGLSASFVSRAMDTLEAEGLATRLPSGHYALSAAALGIAVAHAEEMAHAGARIHELTQRVAAAAAR